MRRYNVGSPFGEIVVDIADSFPDRFGGDGLLHQMDGSISPTKLDSGYYQKNSLDVRTLRSDRGRTIES